jgi:hypothetical protein
MPRGAEHLGETASMASLIAMHHKWFGDREEDLTVLTSQTAYDVLNWPCIRSRPKARKPPTRSCARGEEPKATEFDCGAGSYWIERSTTDPFLVES